MAQLSLDSVPSDLKKAPDSWTECQKFVYIRTYSRWRDEDSRRESWEETVERMMSFLFAQVGDKVPAKVYKKIREQVTSLSVMPSMRLLWAAGPAAIFDNTTMYNCSFMQMRAIEDFSEMLYILMCGTGVGFSVSAEDIAHLPSVPMMTSESAGTFQVADSKAGWADSLKALMYALYQGKDLEIDYSKIRKKGERLKTMGGRASGPEPLIRLHQYVKEAFQNAQGRKLNSLEVHDICCQIAEIVVVGGVRRSSLISLSDLNDDLMMKAKVHPFPVRRYMANNSAIYDKKPTAVEFLKEWASLAASGSGERGIYNRFAATLGAPARRKWELIRGVNPCAEIALRDHEFCNLSEVVVRATDTFDDLLAKVETATWIGAIQSTFTNFPYLRKEWAENCQEERLLGVSLTGQFDAPHLMTAEKVAILKARAIATAKKASKALGIPMPASITCVKPSGTVSQLVDSASGMHARYSEFYIRRYRIASMDPLFRMLRDQFVPMSPENGQRKSDWEKAKEIMNTKGLADAKTVCSIFTPDKEWDESLVNTWVLSFPVKAPEGCITVDQVSAIDQLEWYKKIQKNWCEHNASVTVYVKDDEWMKVGEWVYQNWNFVVGVSFLPYDNGSYEQAPYERLTKEQYEAALATFPKIDYSALSFYELEDNTEGSKAYACVSGVCELT